MQEECLRNFREMPKEVDWDYGLEVWKQFFGTNSESGKTSTNESLNAKTDNIVADQNIHDTTFSSIDGLLPRENKKETDDIQRKKTTFIANEVVAPSSNSQLSKSFTHLQPFLPRYRVTCKRTGDHVFQSPQAAHNFGGAINDLRGWIVDLSAFQVGL